MHYRLCDLVTTSISLLIVDNDGNYDDILAFLYIAQNFLFDLKGITLEATVLQLRMVTLRT